MGKISTYWADILVGQILGKAGADIICSDFEEVIAKTKKGDFVYLDPPYAVENQRIFTQYNPQCFGYSDLQRLARALEDADKRGVKFVLSYASCKEAKQLLGDWNIRRISINRNIAGFSKFRKKSFEIIVSNIVKHS